MEPFEVGTFTDNDGAVAGKHKVIILQVTGNYLTEQLSDDIKHEHGDLISSTYFDYRTSGLECEIVPGQNPVEFVVKKNPRQTRRRPAHKMMRWDPPDFLLVET